jgi:FkbM family methyltransferase
VLPFLAAELSQNAVGLWKELNEVAVYVPAIKDVLFDAMASTDPARAERFAKRLLRWHKSSHVKRFVCPVRGLDSFALDPVFIKIDVEGAEREVIQGSMETIKRCRPVLLVEFGERVLDLLPNYRVARFVGGRFVDQGTDADAYLIPQEYRPSVRQIS